MRNLIVPLFACIACAVVVSITAVIVRPEQIANVENEKKVKILSAACIKFEVSEDEKERGCISITNDQVDEEFKKITTVYVDFRSNEFVAVDPNYDHLKAVLKPELSELVPKEKDIAILKRRENVGPIYVWTNEDKELEKVVIPIRGYGLWGTLYGYLSLASDLNSVNGIEYYDHKETPGLGGEVDADYWKDTWVGKLVYNQDGGVDPNYDHLKAVLKPELSELVPKEKDIAILKRRENVGPIYVWANEDKELEKVVIPIRGYGLWGTLYGYLSLASDLNSVNGIEYYDHKETPGLGGEVDADYWKDTWVGKLVYNQDGGVDLRVVKGAAKDEYQVDGLTGATLTSNGVTDMINYWLGDEAYGPALRNLKGHIKNL